MLKRLFLVALVTLIGLSTVSAQFNKAEQQFLKTPYRMRVDGDSYKSSRVDGKTNFFGLPSLQEFVQKIKTLNSDKFVPTISTVAIFTTGTTDQDYASNSSPAQIWQDPNNPNNIHAISMTEPTGLRVSAYYFSSDKGATWSYIGDVPAVRSGYPAIDGFADGSALVVTHTTDGGTNARLQAYKDLGAGLGSFTRLDVPGNDIAAANIWGRVVSTSNLTLSNKFIMSGSINGATGIRYAVNTGLTTPGTWINWTEIDPNGATAEKYPLARGTDGRIGLAWLDAGTDVWFMESTNNGTSFSTPLKIFTPVFDPITLEGYGPVTGISIAYKGNTPVVAFEGELENSTGYFPGLPAKVFFWSNTLPGVDPNRCVVVVDSSKVPYYPYVGINYNDGTITHPNIGVSADGSKLFIAYVAASQYIDVVDSTSDCDIWLSGSANGGLTWPVYGKVSTTTPIKDWRYVSVSKWNDNTGTDYYCNMTAIRGNIAGSFVGGAPVSVEELWSLRSHLIFTSITPISTEVPANYSLSQNYPNPFNPTTNIKFAISKSGFVNLKVYDLSGKEVSSLVNEKLSAGTYQYSLNAANLSSGIYFYTLRADGFTETKKMMLIK